MPAKSVRAYGSAIPIFPPAEVQQEIRRQLRFASEAGVVSDEGEGRRLDRDEGVREVQGRQRTDSSRFAVCAGCFCNPETGAWVIRNVRSAERNGDVGFT